MVKVLETDYHDVDLGLIYVPDLVGKLHIVRFETPGCVVLCYV